jgi:AraC-like DNA-binding protein
MHYTEHPVPPALQRHLQCLWVLRDPHPGPDIQVVYPDGRCELVVELGVPLRFHGADGRTREHHACVFAGQQRGPIRLQAAGPVHCLGLRLHAAAGALVAGAHLPSLRDQAPDLYTLDPGFARAFEACARDGVATGSMQALWSLLQPRCEAFGTDDPVERAAAIIDARQGDVRIAELAQLTGLGLRTLQQRFLALVGVTCKEYARIRRLHALVRTLDAGELALADAAAQHGYSDQAHATHELVRFTGTTPARLVRALGADRGSDAALQLALAFVRGRSVTRTA